VFETGQWIEGQYILLERRRGRQWIHYVAHDRISENVFVIKRPSESLCPNYFSAGEFRTRARAWTELAESGELVRAYLLKEFEGIPHLFLEYFDDYSLEDILALDPGKPFSMDHIVEFIKQFVHAMKHLHSRSLSDGSIGLTHGNLTPQSILIESETIKLTDIGLPNVFRSAGGAVNADILASKKPYMAPELISHPEQTDTLTDTYSFGAIIYEITTGTIPPANQVSDDPMAGVVGAWPPSPRIRNKECPRWLEETILKCMAPEPERRFQSFEHIESLMNEMLRTYLIQHQTPGDKKGSPSTSRVARIRGVAKKESSRLNHYYLGVEHLLLGLIAEEEGIVAGCLGDQTTIDHVRSELLSRLPKGEGPWHWKGMKKTPRYQRVMKMARKMTRENDADRMLPQHILLAILEEGRSIPVRVLRMAGVDIEAAIESLGREVYRKRSGIHSGDADSGPVRYSSKLPCVCDCLHVTPFIGRAPELERAQSLLLNDGTGFVVVGEPGVGKTAFINQLGEIVSTAATDTGGDILKLRTGALFANAEGNADKALLNLTNAINEMADAGSIVFIEDLPVLLGCGEYFLSHSVAKILEECLVSKNLLVVGTSTPSAYAVCEPENETLFALIEVINLVEPSGDEALEMLKAARESLELEHSVKIMDDALSAALASSRKYRKHGALPGSALELLDRACTAARFTLSISGEPEAGADITAEHVEHVLARQSSGR